MRTDGADVLHLPGPGFIPVGPACECTDGTNIDASTAFIALEVIALIRNNFGRGAAVSNSQRVDAKSFATDTNAAIAKNTAGRIVEDNGRPLLLVDMDFRFAKTRFTGSVAEHH